jgi:hypothetical protein
MSEALTKWSDEVVELVTLIEGASARLQALSQIPGGGEADARLRTLWDLWDRLKCGTLHPNFATARGHQFKILAGRLQAANDLQFLLERILRELGRLSESGAAAPRPVLRASEFPALARIGSFGGTTLLGDPKQLPSEHFGRTLVPDTELFTQGGRGFLVLGPDEAPFYPAEDVARITREWSTPQRVNERSRKEKEQLEQQISRQEFSRTPAGILEEMERRLAATGR